MPASRAYRVANRDGWLCRYCETELTAETATVDHVIPLSRGGRNAMTNLVLACRPCNGWKGDRLLSELPVGWQRMARHNYERSNRVHRVRTPDPFTFRLDLRPEDYVPLAGAESEAEGSEQP